jgi:hypothetical protein
VIGALEPEELQDFELARNQYGTAAEDFIQQCSGLHEAFAWSLKPATGLGRDQGQADGYGARAAKAISELKVASGRE